MPKNTVAGGGSYAGHDDIPLNPDGQRAVAEGRVPDRDKSAFIGTEVSEDDYKDAMKRHGTDEYTTHDKMVVDNYRLQRSDEERAKDEERDGDSPGARGRDAKDGASSRGKTSSRSSVSQQKTDENDKGSDQSTAPTTAGPSEKTARGTSSVRSTGGSGTVGR